MKRIVSWAILEDIQKYAKNLFSPNELEEDGANTDPYIIKRLQDYYKKHLPIDIIAWARVNEPDNSLLYKNSFYEQINFVQDILSRILLPSYDEYEKSPVMIISTHVSKSVTLPVYQFKLEKYGLEITLRNNFYDWKVSINSQIPIEFDPMGLIDKNKTISFCEGFPTGKLYGSYNSNHSQFTFEIRTNYDLYTYFYLLNNYIKTKADA